MSNEPGWVLVPKVATPEMLHALFVLPDMVGGTIIRHSVDKLPEAYRAMLAAAPPSPAVRVTPQMVEAGAKAIWSLEWPHDPSGWDQVWGPAKERFVELAKAALAVSFPIQQDADDIGQQEPEADR